MKAYKEDQGRIVRMASFWALIFLLLFGVSSLHELLGTRVEALQPAIGGLRVPLVGWEINGAFLIALAVLVGGAWLLYARLNRPKTADLLIETESELRKVTWPTGQEVGNSSVVVILSVLFLMGFLAASDYFFGALMKALFIGE
jgi:preprotein translocase SecE subunit